jgi:hypothetical protein
MEEILYISARISWYGLGFSVCSGVTDESIIDQTCFSEISPSPSLPKRGIPPFGKGREGGI